MLLKDKHYDYLLNWIVLRYDVTITLSPTKAVCTVCKPKTFIHRWDLDGAEGFIMTGPIQSAPDAEDKECSHHWVPAVQRNLDVYNFLRTRGPDYKVA